MVIQNEWMLGSQTSQLGKLLQAIERLMPFLTTIRRLGL